MQKKKTYRNVEIDRKGQITVCLCSKKKNRETRTP